MYRFSVVLVHERGHGAMIDSFFNQMKSFLSLLGLLPFYTVCSEKKHQYGAAYGEHRRAGPGHVGGLAMYYTILGLFTNVDSMAKTLLFNENIPCASKSHHQG